MWAVCLAFLLAFAAAQPGDSVADPLMMCSSNTFSSDVSTTGSSSAASSTTGKRQETTATSSGTGTSAPALGEGLPWPCNSTDALDDVLPRTWATNCSANTNAMARATAATEQSCQISVSISACFADIATADAAAQAWSSWMMLKIDVLDKLTKACSNAEDCALLQATMVGERFEYDKQMQAMALHAASRSRRFPAPCNVSFIPDFLLGDRWSVTCLQLTTKGQDLLVAENARKFANYEAEARRAFKEVSDLIARKQVAMTQMLSWPNCSCAACQQVVGVALAAEASLAAQMREAFSKSVLEKQRGWDLSGLLLAVCAVTLVACAVVFVLALVWKAILTQMVTVMLACVFASAALWLSATVVAMIGFGGIGGISEYVPFTLTRAGAIGELATITIFFVMWVDAIFGFLLASPRIVIVTKVVLLVFSVLLCIVAIVFTALKYTPGVLDVTFTVLYASLLALCLSMVVLAFVARSKQADATARGALLRMIVAVAILAASFAVRLAMTIVFELRYYQGANMYVLYNFGIALPMAVFFAVMLIVICLTYYKTRLDSSRSDVSRAERRKNTQTEQLLPSGGGEASEYDSELSYRSEFGDATPKAYDV